MSQPSTDRYLLFDAIAAGGMATVHLGRLVGAGGFARVVAIKRLHPQFARDPEFVSMFREEARVTANVRHANVVGVIDVIERDGELLLVMDYIHGEVLAKLSPHTGAPAIPPSISSAIVANLLRGLHAAHVAADERGTPLEIVHRDVSPQNVIVGLDGVARVVDFGIAKAVGRAKLTDAGSVKGKLSYMSPEQLGGRPATAASDQFSASVVLRTLLTGRALFAGDSQGEIIGRVLEAPIARPGSIVRDLPAAIDDVTLRGLSRDRTKRFPSAAVMADAVERALPPATPAEVAQWMEERVGASLAGRKEKLSGIVDGTRVPSVIVPLDAAAAREAAPVTPLRGRTRRFRAVTVGSAMLLLTAAGIGARAAVRPRAAGGAMASAQAGASAEPTPSSPAPVSAASETSALPGPSASSAAAPDTAPPRAATSTGGRGESGAAASRGVAAPRAPKPSRSAAPARSATPDCYEIGPSGETRIRAACLR